MKKLMIGITILSIGLMAYGGYTSRRWSAPSATTDVNYAELAALIDANDLTDPNSHNAVTVTDSNSIDLTLAGQNITADINEVWLAANAGTGSVATHESTYDHNDIATALQPSAIGTTIQAYDSNLPDFPTDPDADKFLKWDDTNSVLVWADANSAATGTGDMLLATYDTLENGFVDGNDTEYGDDWDSNPDAPSMNAVYDKFESVVSGTLGFTSSDSVTFTIVDGNLVPDVNDTWFADNVPTGTVGFASSDSITFTIIDGNLVPDINDAWLDVNAPAGTGSGDANAVMAAHLAEFDHNDISAYRYYSFSLPDPNSIYDSNAVFPIDCNVASALSLLQVRVVCDKNPATELDLDLKYSTDETLAGATVISALDTTAGKSTTYLTSSVAATKFFYIQFGARPSSDIDWMRVDIKCTTNEFDFKQAVIVEPNECYDVNAIFPVDYCFNAATISQIQFKCDINPTNEPNITLYYGDAQTGSGTKICDIDTTDGKVTVNSFDDATITAGSDIWGVWNERPDADIKWEIIKIARTK